jgi:hypothetical protein
MKIMGYTCHAEEIKEKRDWLLGMGLNIFRQTSIIDVESTPPTNLIRILFDVPNQEVETFLKLAYPAGTFQDYSA